MFDQAFAGLAVAFSTQYGGPFMDAVAVFPGTPIEDEGGSIVTPAAPVRRACKVQFDIVTDAMRGDAGFMATDVRILVLAGTLSGPLNTTAEIEVASGANAGRWTLESCQGDPVSVGYECRGRAA